MSEWKKCRIGDLVTLRQGFAINAKSKHYISKERTSLALLRIADMKSGSREIFIREDIPQNFIARAEDIVYTRTGNVGLVFRNNYGVVHNNCFTVTPNEESVLSRDFLFYLLQSKDFYDKANSLARGAAQPDLPHTLFNSIEIQYPSVPVQHRIAAILSRYDSLIENYQKQIKLLEEAAQRLYKEWFVDLRFPGHEHTKIDNGLPDGWEKKMIGEIAEINKRNIPKNYEYSFVNYTDLGNVRLGNMDSPIIYDYGEEPGRAKRVAIDGDIIWGMVRPNLKSYTLVQYPKEQDVFSTGFAVLTAKRVPFSFLYCHVTTEAFVGYLVNCTNGAAYPAVKPEHFSKAEIVIPSKYIMDVFNGLVEPMFRIVGNFQSQIRLLTEARDRLLPKLMSGEKA